MKNTFKYGLAALITAMTFAACSDDESYSGPGEWNATSDYADVYFKQASVSEELDPADEMTTTLSVYRRVKHEYTYGKDSNGNDSVISDKILTPLPALVMPLEIVSNADDVFTVGDAAFAEGDTVATFKVDFPKAEIGTTYTLKLKVTDPKYASYYSSSNVLTYSVSRAKWTLLGTGVLEENFYIGGSNEVEIYQKDSEKNVFRVMHPFDQMLAEAKADTEHWAAEEFDGSQPEYLTITIVDDNLVTYPSFSTGCFHPTYGQTVWCHHPGHFTSLSDPSNWTYNKVVSYQEDEETPGQIQLAPYYYMDGVGGWNNTQADGIIVITFPGYTPPYIPDLSSDEDFTWETVFQGVFQSEKMGTASTATLYKGTCIATQNDADKIFAETYGTAYCLASPYAEGYNIYFAIDKEGGITLPEGCELQETGLDAVGSPVFAKILVPESSYTDNYLVLGIQFQNESGSLVYGKASEKLMNLTYSEVGKGVYTYGVQALSQDAESFYEGTENATLFQCDQLKGNYYLKPWAKSEEGLNFTIGQDGKIRFYQYTGEAFQDYGDVYFIDLEAYNPSYTSYLGEYDEKNGTFEFCGAYYIPGAGGFGLVAETFQLGDAARLQAPAARRNSMPLMFKRYQAASRFVPQTVTKDMRHGVKMTTAMFAD